MGKDRPRLHQPTREEIAQLIYECQALELCGDVEMAKRLAFARFYAERRRELGTRIIVAPAPEVPEGE